MHKWNIKKQYAGKMRRHAGLKIIMLNYYNNSYYKAIIIIKLMLNS